MDKSIIQFGYCPVQDTTYFVNIGYKLKEINYYVKVKASAVMSAIIIMHVRIKMIVP